MSESDTSEEAAQTHAAILDKFRGNPALAHRVIFAKRHTHATPPFHDQIIADFWSDHEFTLTEAFREGAKSTLAEEGIAVMAGMAIDPFYLIVGANYDRACDRLTAIKHEIDNNELFIAIFGDQHGEVWNEGEIVLKNGVKIQALGAGMKFRGVKYKNARPKFVLIDDLEDEDNTATEEKRAKLSKWVSRVLLPACRSARKRVVGTPIHPQCWLETMRKVSGWLTRVFPIVVPAVVDSSRWERSQWPDRYPLEYILKIRDEYERNGDLQGFVQEYLCQSEDESLKPFKASHYIVAPAVPRWAPSFVICDPARKGNSTRAARTGYSVDSWVGHKLYVRHAAGAYHQPTQIIDELFKLDDVFKPVWIGVEKDGLEEFLMQPLRNEMVKRGIVLPIKPLMAPRDRDKTGFIKGLHPFFEAGDVLMCGEFPELRQEILNFPTGLNDIFNTLAYALRMRAGKPVYEDFGFAHVAPDELRPHAAGSLYLVLNVEPGFSAGALVQFVNRTIRVFGDWVKEGGIEDALEQLIPEAVQLAAGRQFKYFAPGEQFNEYNNLGLPQAARRLRIKIDHGPAADLCVGSLVNFLRATTMMQPSFMCSPSCRWTINGLSQGYARGVDKSGVLSPLPEPGYYATLLRGIESFAKWLTVRVEDTAEGQAANYALTPDGRRYMTARAGGGMNEGRDFKR